MIGTLHEKEEEEGMDMQWLNINRNHTTPLCIMETPIGEKLTHLQMHEIVISMMLLVILMLNYFKIGSTSFLHEKEEDGIDMQWLNIKGNDMTLPLSLCMIETPIGEKLTHLQMYEIVNSS